MSTVVAGNAGVYGLSERRRHWLEAATDLAEALQPPIGLDDALAAVARRARTAARAHATAVVQFPVGQHPVVAAQDGPAGVDVTETVRRVVDEARTAGELAVVLEVDLGDQRALVLPLRAHLADPSVLLVVLDTAGAIEVEERELLAAFADQAGLAVDRAEAVTDRAELAVVSERARIARDLHDVVIQRLFAAGLRLDGLRRATADHEVDAALGSVIHDLDLTIRDIRTTIFGLRQPARSSLRSAAEELVGEYADACGFTPAFRCDGPVDTLVPGQVAEHVLAVLREGLANVARHAHARTGSVELVATADEVVLRIADDGDGVPDQRTESGLANARDRAALLGGSFDVSTGRRPGAVPGTTLTWRAPIG